jgi:adenine-specific DNA-methyltransferase
MIYRPDSAFLKSPQAALTLEFAERARKARPDKRSLVFAPSKFVANRTLLGLGCEYAPLPFALFRV